MSDRDRLRILGIGGSTRRGSYSLVALRSALKLAEEMGARTTLADVRELALPVYDDDWSLVDYPPSLAWLLDEVRAADACILCSPTYHCTIAGGVKNALDALNFLADEGYFHGRAVGLMAMGGASAMNVVNTLYHSTRGLNGLSASTVVTLPRDVLDPETLTVRDAGAHRRLTQMVTEVIDLTRRLRLA